MSNSFFAEGIKLVPWVGYCMLGDKAVTDMQQWSDLLSLGEEKKKKSSLQALF